MDTKFKGVSLSIETIVIVIVCSLVLLVSILFFTGVIKPISNSTSQQTDLSGECMDWGHFGWSNESYNCTRYPSLCSVFGENDTKARDFCIKSPK